MKGTRMKSMKQKLVISTGASLALLLLVSTIISIVSLLFTGNERLISQETISRQAFDRLIQEQVGSATSVASHYNDLYLTGELTLEQAKLAAADVIRTMRYGSDGYFWVDTSQGDNVVLLGNATEGTNRMDAKDTNGFAYVKSFVEQSKLQGGGYADYYFPRAGQTQALPKRSYTLYFEPFDWVIGTGNYVDQIDTELNTLKKSIQVELIVMILVTVVVGMVLLLLGLQFATRLSKSFSNQLSQLLHVSEKVANGDTDIPLLDSDIVEIQQLNQSYTAVADGILEQAGVLERIANGDFTVNIAARSEHDVLVHSINKMVALLDHTLNKINLSASQVTNGASQVSDGAQALAQSATEQASSVEILSEEIANISLQIRNTASNAASADEQTGTVGAKLMASNQQMSQMSSAMSEISRSSVEIAKIIKTIEDIAFQTNILALNAAVEAARAGAAGKGFAVVADEVRNLANKSGEAAKQTGVLIEDSVNSVYKGVQIAETTAASLVEVVAGAQEITQLIAEISQASTAQTKSISQIMQEIDQISAVVQTNSATSEESAASSEELSSQAELMKSLVSRFKLKDDKTEFQYLS